MKIDWLRRIPVARRKCRLLPARRSMPRERHRKTSNGRDNQVLRDKPVERQPLDVLSKIVEAELKAQATDDRLRN